MSWLDLLKSGVDTATDYVKDNKGQIISGIAGAVLGNEGGGSSKTGQTVETMPPWMTDYAQTMLQQSAAIAGQPYQQYGGPRVAGLTQDQEDANNMVRSNAGQASGVIANAMGNIDPNAGRGMLAQAGQYLQNAGDSWLDNGTSGRYMADYTANVTNPAVSQAMRTWNEQINPNIQSTFSGSKGVGAYGSSAMLKSLQGAGSRLTQVLGDDMAKYLQQGYTTGQNQFNTENNTQGQLAGIASNLGQTEQTMGLNNANATAGLAERWANQNTNDANNLSNVGENQRQLNQAAMDVDFQNWAKAQGYSQEQLDAMLKTLQGVQGSTGRTTNTTGTTDDDESPLKNAATAISLYNTVTGKKNSEDPLDEVKITAEKIGDPQAVMRTQEVGPAMKARGGLLRRISRAA